MEVRLLGELEVDAGGSTVEIRGVKARTLLAVLALHRGEPVPPDRLIDILWADDPPGNPANALQALVATVRRGLGSTSVVTTDAGYALGVAPDDLDIERFERLVAEGRRHLDEGDAANASATLRAASELCRDEPLVEFAYAEFASGERVRLQELVLVAVEGRIEADLALGRHAELVAELEALCDRHPFRERLWELRMLALYRSGRQADALRAYGDARTALVEDVGLEPGPGLRDLEARILDQDPTLDPPAPRRAMPRSDGNIREPLNSFVGRDDEIARVLELSASARLVTLIGPGGAGKTRLAVEAALRLRPEFPGGAWMVELAGMSDPEGIASAVATTLEVSRETMAVTTVDQIVDHLRGRSLVVVLDNCEHVVAEAAFVAEALVHELPDLRLVATSREALGVPGEVLVPVGGLELPAAVDVFVDRAAAVRPGFVLDDDDRGLVEDVCRRLDGLPLAVELAAARLRALPLPQLAELLVDRFRVLTGGARTALPRQQTLRAVVDWSYDLLFEDERRMLARLAVFAGGCSLEAAEAVCSDDLLPRDDILDLLGHLVDKSLVVADVGTDGSARYRQLQTLWDYGRERLAASGEATEIRRRHAEWFLAMAHDARQGLRGHTGPACRARLIDDWENLRAALDTFVDAGDADAALALTGGVGLLWFLRGDPQEGVRWLGEALALPGGDPVERAGASAWHAYFDAWFAGPAVAVAEGEAAIDALRGVDEPLRLAEALILAIELHNRNDDRQRSREVIAEAQRVLDEVGDQWLLGTLDAYIAQDHIANGDLDAGAAASASSVERLRSVGEHWLIFEGLNMLAAVGEWRGDLDEAAAAFGELLESAERAGLGNYFTFSAVRLAMVRARQGDDEGAEELFELVAGNPIRPVNRGWSLIGRGGVLRRLGDPARARRCLDEALSLFDSLGFELGSSAALTSLCWWALDAGELDDAEKFALDASRRAAAEPRSRAAAAAEIAASAVACARSGDWVPFVALADARDAKRPDEFVGQLSSTIGDHFDAPDVAHARRRHARR